MPGSARRLFANACIPRTCQRNSRARLMAVCGKLKRALPAWRSPSAEWTPRFRAPLRAPKSASDTRWRNYAPKPARRSTATRRSSSCTRNFWKTFSIPTRGCSPAIFPSFRSCCVSAAEASANCRSSPAPRKPASITSFPFPDPLREAIMQSISVRTARRTQMVDVTQEVQRVVTALGVKAGTCFLYVPHTTAGVLINEHADPDVASDAEGALDRLVPSAGPYRHAEGNSDSHVKTMLVGTSQFVFVEDGKLALGRWPGSFSAEFDGPRERHLYVKVIPHRVEKAV